MNIKTIIAVGVLALVAACARNPESIAPTTMPTNAYSNLSCERLAAELQNSQAELDQAEADQRQAVMGDAAGVFLVGVPVSSLTGADKEGTVAQKKGEVPAIESAQQNQGCES